MPALYRIDPRAMDVGEMVRFTTDISRQVAAADATIRYNYISTLTQLGHLFARRCEWPPADRRDLRRARRSPCRGRARSPS